jgi:type VII secretion-associated serine protease mycosin
MRSDRRSTARLAVASAVVTVLVGLSSPPAFADSVRDAQWHLQYLRVAEAHKITKGGGVTVAVIDSGVEAQHPDLQGSILPGVNMTILKEGSAVGWTDEDGHGTGMAGLVAAHGRGADGAIGIAPEAKVLPIRTMAREGDRSAGYADAVQFAIDHGAKVINMSFTEGTGGEDEDVIKKALAADVVLVGAAGNAPADKEIIYPAAYPGVVAVGATDRDGRRAAQSVSGPAMALTAPGVDIMSTGLKSNEPSGYRVGSGTSGSAAIVSGVAALVRAKFPELSAEEVVHRLTATATDKGAPGRDPEYGYGIVNIVDALTANVEPLATATGAAPPQGAPSQPHTLPRKQWPIGALVAIGGGLVLLVGAVVGMVIWLARRRTA